MKVGKLGWLVAMFLSGGMAIAQGTAMIIGVLMH